jgi:hypothetical protein
MTSAAHVYGKRVIAAEAFTAMPKEKWQAHPAAMKPLGDWAFTAGVNHFIFHRYALQPWPDRRPGMTMGAWGTHYERTQTWWELSGPWHRYLTRCQHMLRQGLPVADLLYLTPEGAPMRFAAPEVNIRDAVPPDTPGYNVDGCPPDALFTRVAILDGGGIALPDGKRYRALVLPDPAGEMPGGGLDDAAPARSHRRLGRSGLDGHWTTAESVAESRELSGLRRRGSRSQSASLGNPVARRTHRPPDRPRPGDLGR